MSLIRQSILASCPNTTRGEATPLSADAKGERIAYASNKSIFLRPIDDPSQSVQYTGHTANTTVARFAPSGYYVASGDESGMVRVWDAVGEDNITKGEYHIINGKIVDIAWDGESKRIIAVGNGKERFGHCISWDSGNSVGEISGHCKVINSVSIRSTRPYRAVTGSDDKSLVFFHGPPFKFNTSMKDHHSNFVQGVAFSPDGERIVSVGSDRKIFLFDGKTGEFISQVEDKDNGHNGSIFAVSWSSDSKKFVTASGDQTVKIWDLESQKCAKTWKFGEPASVPHQQVGVVWPNRSDGTIISLSNSGELNYLSQSHDKPIKVVSGHQKSITAMGVDRSGKTLWTGSYDGRVVSWDIATGAAEVPEGQSHSNLVVGFGRGGDGRMYSVGMDDTLRSLDTGVKTFTGGILSTDGQPKGISTKGPDGVIVIVTLSELAIYVDDKKTTSLSIDYTPTCVSFSKKTSVIAVGAQDNSVYLYKYTSPQSKPLATKTLKGNRSAISSVAFAPNSALLAAGDSAGKIVLYDSESGESVTTRWQFHTARVTSISWNPEGTHVVSSSLDTSLNVYSVETPSKYIKSSNAHKEGTNAAVWIDKDTVASAGSDGCVKIWKAKLH